MGVKISGGRVGSIEALKKQLSSGKKKGGNNIYPTRVPKDGSLLVHFLTEPTEWTWYKQYFVAGQGYTICVEGRESDWEDLGINPSTVFLANALNVETQQVIVVQLPKTLAEDVIFIYDRKGSILDWDIDLVRDDSGERTEYRAATDERVKIDVSRFELKDLEAVKQNLLKDEDKDDVEADIEDDEDDEPAAKPVAKRRVVRRGSK